MYSQQRLADLENILDTLYKKLGHYQLKIAEGISLDQAFYYTQQINNDIKPSIRKYEEEKYWWRLAEEAHFYSVEVKEVDARHAIVEVVPKVEQIVNKSNTNYSNELMEKLQRILDKLNERDTAAAAKLKAALPLIPGIMYYEVELDTENSLIQVFDGIKRIFKKAIDEKKT
jgi:hypothetical protein